MWLSYVTSGYASNPHEIEASARRSGGVTDEVLSAIATARAFTLAAEAQSTVLLLDRPGREPTMVEVDEWLDAEITEDDDVTSVPSSAVLEQPARPLLEIWPTPASAISIDVQTGELAAPLGSDRAPGRGRSRPGDGVRRPHRRERVEFATSDPETSITFAARVGERVVLAAGDEQFEL